MRIPKPLTLVLTQEEAGMLLGIHVKGGHAGFKKRLIAKPVECDDGWRIDLNDAEIGELVRHIGRYGRGGWQHTLRKAFARSLIALIRGKK